VPDAATGFLIICALGAAVHYWAAAPKPLRGLLKPLGAIALLFVAASIVHDLLRVIW
jgi:hypothetical protein